MTTNTHTRTTIYAVLAYDGLRDACDSKADALTTAQEIANESGQQVYVFKTWRVRDGIYPAYAEVDPIARRDPEADYDGPREAVAS